jgi:hypothetical protein
MAHQQVEWLSGRVVACRHCSNISVFLVIGECNPASPGAGAVPRPRSNITVLKSNICCATDLAFMSGVVRYGGDSIRIVSDYRQRSAIESLIIGGDQIKGFGSCPNADKCLCV